MRKVLLLLLIFLCTLFHGWEFIADLIDGRRNSPCSPLAKGGLEKIGIFPLTLPFPARGEGKDV
jgi:hypothetical protein